MIYDKVAWLGADFIPTFIAYVLSFIALFIGSITDLKTREVPDWVNYGLIISGVMLNLLFSFIFSNPSFIVSSVIGLSIFFGIAYIMFYSGQWGGGDSKILMGLGAMIGVNPSLVKSQFLFGFFINALFVGAAYGLLWSFFLVFKNRQKFMREFNKILIRKNIVKLKRFILIALILLLPLIFFIKLNHIKMLGLSLAFLILTTFYLWIFVKAVEKSCMHKLVEPSKLTEGDWIVNDVIVGRKYICGPKDLGISKRQIRNLIEYYKEGKVNRILVKEGVPFVPSFLIAFIVTLVFGNPLIWLI
ncbi:MAG: A24 family peptidase [Nanoarchaeota archaeon]